MYGFGLPVEQVEQVELTRSMIMRRTVLLAVAVTALVVLAAGTYAAPRAAGTVKVDGKNIAIELKLGNKIKVVVTPKGMRFPVGTYVPTGCTYMKRDSAGKVWSLRGQTRNFTVEKDQTTVLENIPVIEVRGILEDKRRDARTGQIYYYVFPNFKGKDGQSCGVYARRGAARKSPMYRIEDERGRVLAQGKFGFG